MILLILTYLAGVLTILSPCILPVLPFVFSRSQGSFAKNGVPLLLGMAVTFAAFSGLAIVGAEWVAKANEVGRYAAMALLTIFGLALVFPQFAEKILEPVTHLGSRLGQGSAKKGYLGSFVIGISTGLLWAPCAGPILGLVLTGAATQGDIGRSLALLLSYSLGAATSLGLALVAGNRFLGTLKKFLGVDRVVKKALGIAVLLGVVAIALNLDRTVLTRISKFETVSLENKLLEMTGVTKAQTASADAPMPELSGATGWLNSAPLSKKDLLGKVVLIDFWTYSCINCLRTLPYVKEWGQKYGPSGLVVIGVHTPEFAFEKSAENVKSAVRDLGISYPVVLDSDYQIWNAFHNNFWPAHYFVDRKGNIRGHHFGEGEYDKSEKMITELLTEGGHNLVATAPVALQASGASLADSGAAAISPETYVGYGRAENFVGEVHEDLIADYRLPAQLSLNQWGLGGSWLIAQERAVLQKSGGRIRFRFRGRDLHLVLGAGAGSVKFKVFLDGRPPGADHGEDIDAQGLGEIHGQRLYQLIRQKGDSSGEHTFEIEFLAPGVEAYAFTFG